MDALGFLRWYFLKHTSTGNTHSSSICFFQLSEEASSIPELASQYRESRANKEIFTILSQDREWRILLPVEGQECQHNLLVTRRLSFFPPHLHASGLCTYAFFFLKCPSPTLLMSGFSSFLDLAKMSLPYRHWLLLSSLSRLPFPSIVCRGTSFMTIVTIFEWLFLCSIFVFPLEYKFHYYQVRYIKLKMIWRSE